MPESNEWLFDILWELSDKSYEAGLPELAGKLEEAMDTYLAECHLALPKPAAFQSSRKPQTTVRDRAEARISSRTERRQMMHQLSENLRTARQPKSKEVVWHKVGSRVATRLV